MVFAFAISKRRGEKTPHFGDGKIGEPDMLPCNNKGA
jgi:hypothetical protein